jgi:transposase
MDQTGYAGRRSSTPSPEIARFSPSFEYSRTAANSGFVGARRRKFWISGRPMDLPASGESDRTRTGCEIPPGACEPHPQRVGLDAPEAHPTSQAAPGSRNTAMERRALARVEKKAQEEGRAIVFIDESGFYLLPIVVRTYAPRGCTPILKEYLSYDHLSTIGAVTPTGRLFLKTYTHSITSREVVAFLKQLQRLIQGLLLVIWDGSPTHRSKVIKEYLSSGAAKRIHLERLPGYAPELNPTEWVWSYLKVADLANIACDLLPELDALMQKAKKRLQRKPDLIQAFIRDAGCEV